MKNYNKIIALLLFVVLGFNVYAQEDGEDQGLKLSGEFISDQRFLQEAPHNWVWNENRISLNMDRKISGKSSFHSEVWMKNFGVPRSLMAQDLFNKGILDPYDFEIREAYAEVYGFLTKNLDVKIGRQRIAWGTADKLNPTDNLNPYDLEDLLDFGRHRASDAINFQYYINSDFSIQAVYIPLYRPINMPVGIFANAMAPAEIKLPEPYVLAERNQDFTLPEYNLENNASYAAKFKGFLWGVDFSVSYVFGRDGLPMPVYNLFTPIDLAGNIKLDTKYAYARNHIVGADFSTSIAGIGVWGEVAGFLPEREVVLTTEIPAMKMKKDTVLLEKEFYFKYVAGLDYHFAYGMYLNFQYMHGFVTERGNDALNDYFFMRFEKKLFEDKLCIIPLNGGFGVSDWDAIDKNYALLYLPEISYKATDNAELKVSAAFIEGKGESTFSKFNKFDLLMFSFKYNF